MIFTFSHNILYYKEGSGVKNIFYDYGKNICFGFKTSVSFKILFVCKDVGGKIAETVFTKLTTNKLNRTHENNF